MSNQIIDFENDALERLNSALVENDKVIPDAAMIVVFAGDIRNLLQRYNETTNLKEIK